MKRLIHISTLFTFFALAVCETALSQGQTAGLPDHNDRTVENSSDTARILIPVTVPDGPQMLNTTQPGQLMQTGAFYGIYGWGFEYTMRRENSHLYGSLFVSSMTHADRRIPDARYLVMAGLTVGYETLLHHIGPPGSSTRGGVLRADLDGTQVYARIGPGFGVASTRPENGEFEYHPAIHTSTALGALTKVARRTAFYAELGGRLVWMPTLGDMRFTTGPHLSFGFLIFPPELIPAYEY